MIADRGRQTILTILGVSAGVAATGLWLWRRGTVEAERARRFGRGPRGSAEDVAEALRLDQKLARRGIEVDTVAEGVVELTGAVRDRAESERAVAIAQGMTGVYTVVNRLRVEDEDAQREATRRRWSDGAPELRERRHYGMGSGMGTRRQSPDTDPDRPSDRQRLVEKELDVSKVENEADGPTRGPNTRSRVESTPTKPGDERAIEEAGLKRSTTPPESEDAAAPEGNEEARGAVGEERGSEQP